MRTRVHKCTRDAELLSIPCSTQHRTTQEGHWKPNGNTVLPLTAMCASLLKDYVTKTQAKPCFPHTVPCRICQDLAHPATYNSLGQDNVPLGHNNTSRAREMRRRNRMLRDSLSTLSLKSPRSTLDLPSHNALNNSAYVACFQPFAWSRLPTLAHIGVQHWKHLRA